MLTVQPDQLRIQAEDYDGSRCQMSTETIYASGGVLACLLFMVLYVREVVE